MTNRQRRAAAALEARFEEAALVMAAWIQPVSTTLEALIGEHVLTGVDFGVIPKTESWDEDASSMTFVFDGQAHCVREDPSDGYRSSMRDIALVEDPVINTFAPCRVVCTFALDRAGQRNHVLLCIDAVTGNVVLSMGTDDSDDYYPQYVARFSPENMASNATKTT